MFTLAEHQCWSTATRASKLYSVNIMAYFFCSVFFFAGCAHYENDLVREGKAALEIIPPKVMVKISDVRVLKRENDAEVSGYVKRTGLGIMYGHMDIAILSPDGTVLGMASAEYSPSFRRAYVRRREMRPSSFSARFPDALPSGVVARVAFHPEKLGGVLNCGNNQALLGK